MTFSVATALDDHVRGKFDEREPDGLWHPSSISGCLRQSTYADRGTAVTNPREVRSMRILRVGHLLHGFVQDAVLGQIGQTLRRYFPEIAVAHARLGIVGHTDGLAEMDNGTWEVHEYKTINSMAFKYNDLPKPDHELQACVYIKCIREYGLPGLSVPPLGEALSRARLIYVSKDDLRIEECTVFYTEAKDQEIERRIGVLQLHREAGSLPARLPMTVKKGVETRAWQCGYCPYATKCWDEDDD